MVRVLLGFTTLSTRVGTDTVTEVLAAGRTTDVGGVTMSLSSAVPPESRLTVRSAPGAADAVITNEAGVPSDTTAPTDWMVRFGVVMWGRTDSRVARRPGPVILALV